MVPPRVETAAAALAQLIITAAKLLCIHVRLVERVVRVEKAVVVRMGLQLGLFARDEVGVRAIGLAHFRTRSVGLLRVLTLRSLCYVLQKLALDLHTALGAMVRGLDQPIEVVISDRRVILGAASRAMDLLVICHTTVWILHVQAKVSLCLRLLIFSGAASNVASQRALPDLLLYQLLILFVLLHILL